MQHKKLTFWIFISIKVCYIAVIRWSIVSEVRRSFISSASSSICYCQTLFFLSVIDKHFIQYRPLWLRANARRSQHWYPTYSRSDDYLRRSYTTEGKANITKDTMDTMDLVINMFQHKQVKPYFHHLCSFFNKQYYSYLL